MPYKKLKQENYALLGGINSKASAYVNGPMEFRDLTNVNFSIPGALTKRPGSTLYVGATTSGRINGMAEFERLSGASYLVVSANTNIYSATPSGFQVIEANIQNALTNFTTLVDRLFLANGTNWRYFDGSNTYPVTLPTGGAIGLTHAAGGSLATGTATFVYAYGYLNNRGYYGPATNFATLTIAGNGTANAITVLGITTPSNLGVTAIVLYRSAANSIDLFGTTFLPVGTTTITDTGFPLGSTAINDNLYFTLAPKYMEIYNNSLFSAGFTNAQSTLYWSNIGEPEAITPLSFTEVRTNDGDRITGLKSYNGNIIITKKRSLHRLSGDDTSNYTLTEVTDQYGCLSHRALVTWEDKLWFLDYKGIVEYDAASTRVVSNKVEPIFKSMNVVAAEDNAIGIHDRDNNQVMFAIPCNGATLNNCLVVYDYLSNAWTKYEGNEISAMILAKQALSNKSVMFGGYTGAISFFGSSLASDFGQAITCMIDTRFHNNGQTTEQMWRRFYLNVEPIVGSSQAINLEFKTNYSETVSHTAIIYQAPYQTRLDFGLSARSIQCVASHVSATLPLTVYGYAFESRFQRSV